MFDWFRKLVVSKFNMTANTSTSNTREKSSKDTTALFTGASYATIGNNYSTTTGPAPYTGYKNQVFNVTQPVFTFSTPVTNIITLNGANNVEIVRLNTDGSVTWTNGEDINAAAKAFSTALSLGAEQIAGITSGVKIRMRDSVFNDLINIANDKGSLTSADLTYLLEASKIVEKLQGAE